MTFELLVANVIVGFAGFVQTTTGIGFAMIAVPMLVLIDLSYALALRSSPCSSCR